MFICQMTFVKDAVIGKSLSGKVLSSLYLIKGF